MRQRLRRLELNVLAALEVDYKLTFVYVGTNGKETVNVSGRFEKSPDVSILGYRFRFQDSDGRKGNIGMIFPEEESSQFGEDEVNRLYIEKGRLILEFAVGKCPGTNGCCQPWNNYLRYFDKSN